MIGVKLKYNLEELLFSINRFINIDNDREEYASHFENLKNILFGNLRKIEPFGYLFNGWQLGGSYGDNLKVKLPDEFDMVFHITFPENNLIDVTEDRSLPGNIHLDFTRVLHKISREKQHVTNLRHLKLWLNNNNYLKVDKLQSYIESCFTKVLRDMDYCVLINDNLATLRYSKQGPAHTIFVDDFSGMKYSVDFVPGILLKETQSILKTHVGQWEAIPKPTPNNTSFRSSFYRQEQKVLKNNLSLKNVLRMMKKFRDSHDNMKKMKSYFIKTLFLWKAQQESSSYWRNSLTTIIVDMFKDMEKSLQYEELPFFWDKRLNMYDDYSPKLFREMLKCVESTRETLEQAARCLTPALQRRVYCIFLTPHERMTLEIENIRQDSQWETPNEDLTPKTEEKQSCIIL